MPRLPHGIQAQKLPGSPPVPTYWWKAIQMPVLWFGLHFIAQTEGALEKAASREGGGTKGSCFITKGKLEGKQEAITNCQCWSSNSVNVSHFSRHSSIATYLDQFPDSSPSGHFVPRSSQQRPSLSITTTSTLINSRGKWTTLLVNPYNNFGRQFCPFGNKQTFTSYSQSQLDNSSSRATTQYGFFFNIGYWSHQICLICRSSWEEEHRNDSSCGQPGLENALIHSIIYDNVENCVIVVWETWPSDDAKLIKILPELEGVQKIAAHCHWLGAQIS